MTVPAFVELQGLSPTLASSLGQCWLRVAYSRDPEFKDLRRPTERTALGSAAHALTEKAWRGGYDPGAGSSVEEWLRSAWDQAVEEQHARLKKAWAPAAPPDPADWPGFALTRARLLRRLRAVATEQARQAGGSTVPNRHVAHTPPSLPWVERRLADPTLDLVGTPDRVEQRGQDIVVVDLKSGVHQGDVTEQQRLQLLLYAHLVSVAGLELPRYSVILDGAGTEREVKVDEPSVAAAVSGVTRARNRYNAAVPDATPESMASPAPDTCRGCSYRPVCLPFLRRWSEDWKVGRGVWGALQEQSQHSGSWEIKVLASGPAELKGLAVRVTGLVNRLDAEVGADVAVVRTDVIGSPQVLRARWSTLLWPSLATLPAGASPLPAVAS